MDISKQIYSLIEALKADKSIAQPWRNYALKHFQEGLADFEKGQRTTSRSEPPEMLSQVNTQFESESKREVPQNKPHGCICTPGAKPNANCPIHGLI